jgi:DNA anti-recombination protein RmuC
MEIGLLTGVAACLAAVALTGLAQAPHLRALRSRADRLEAQHGAAIEERQRAREETARLSERVVSLTRQAEVQAEHCRSLEAGRKDAALEAKAAATEVARLKERECALLDKVAAQAAQLADVQNQLTTEFENIAHRILRANASELSESSHKAMAAIPEQGRAHL